MSTFLDIYNGRMSGVMKWHQLDTLWAYVKSQEDWYLYEVGANLPTKKISSPTLDESIDKIDAFLHHEHDKKYCGVVYADNLKTPTLIKIYHPRKMGASCGSSGSTVLPNWTLSKTPPVDLLEWALEKDEKPVWWKHMLKKRA